MKGHYVSNLPKPGRPRKKGSEKPLQDVKTRVEPEHRPYNQVNLATPPVPEEVLRTRDWLAQDAMNFNGIPVFIIPIELFFYIH